MSRAERRVVPLKSRCSRKWLVPARAGVSSREPTGTQMPTLALRTPGIASVTTRRPPGRTVREISPPPVAESSRRVLARRWARGEVIPRSYGPHAPARSARQPGVRGFDETADVGRQRTGEDLGQRRLVEYAPQ